MKVLELTGLKYFYNKYIKKIEQDISTLNNDLWKKIYPVGSIYMSVNDTNPSLIWGGTWVAWGSGRVPVGVASGDSNFNTVEKTGGAASANLSHSHTVNGHSHTTNGHVLTTSEIPSHKHSFSGTTSQNGQHNHTFREWYQVKSEAPSAAQCVAANSDTDANPGAHTKDAGDHTHSFSGTTGSSGSGQAHNHGNTGSASPGTNSQLGSTSVLQPYITCYMWKRTA